MVLPVAVAERVPLRVAAVSRVALADDLVVERRVPVGSLALVVVADLAAVEVWVVVEVAAVRHDELADSVAERDRLGVAAVDHLARVREAVVVGVVAVLLTRHEGARRRACGNDQQRRACERKDRVSHQGVPFSGGQKILPGVRRAART